MSFKWNIDIDITFRILVGLGLIIFGCYMAVLTSKPESFYGYVATGCAMVLVGSKAIKNIKTPWFSIGNGDCNGTMPVLPPNDHQEATESNIGIKGSTK